MSTSIFAPALSMLLIGVPNFSQVPRPVFTPFGFIGMMIIIRKGWSRVVEKQGVVLSAWDFVLRPTLFLFPSIYLMDFSHKLADTGLVVSALLGVVIQENMLALFRRAYRNIDIRLLRPEAALNFIVCFAAAPTGLKRLACSLITNPVMALAIQVLLVLVEVSSRYSTIKRDKFMSKCCKIKNDILTAGPLPAKVRLNYLELLIGISTTESILIVPFPCVFYVMRFCGSSGTAAIGLPAYVNNTLIQYASELVLEALIIKIMPVGKWTLAMKKMGYWYPFGLLISAGLVSLITMWQVILFKRFGKRADGMCVAVPDREIYDF